MINSHDTCANLRLLAKQIEHGESPDFVFCLVDGESVRSAHKAENRPFELLGAMQYRMSKIVQDIE
jgi:hypothetical protein